MRRHPPRAGTRTDRPRIASQNLPGLAVLRSAGYEARATPLLLGAGLASLAAAPFGGHAINLAAITAAICTNEEADPEPRRRWMTGLLCAGFYLVLAAFAPLLVRQFLALPGTLIAALTGVALLPPLSAAIGTVAAAQRDRDAAILTLLVTASGVSLFGMGSALWGIVTGLGTLGAAETLRPSALGGGEREQARGEALLQFCSSISHSASLPDLIEMILKRHRRRPDESTPSERQPA